MIGVDEVNGMKANA